MAALWDDLEGMTAPVMLVRGANSSYIHDDDQAEFARRQPAARIELVEGSGHSVQSDRASYLAGLIADFLATT
jgi:pimeloyl-ACP methyl ester carboxylesterase